MTYWKLFFSMLLWSSVFVGSGPVSAAETVGPVPPMSEAKKSDYEQRERLRGLERLSVSVLIDWGNGPEAIAINAHARKRLEDAGLEVLDKADASIDLIVFDDDKIVEADLNESVYLKRDPNFNLKVKTWELRASDKVSIEASPPGEGRVMKALDAFLKDYKMVNPGRRKRN